MRTKYHIGELDDERDFLDYKKDELQDFFKRNSIQNLRKTLYNMASDISRYETPEKSYRPFINNIKYIINFGWDLVFTDYKYHVRLEPCNKRFIKNPFRLNKRAMSAQYRYRNSGLGYFQGEVLSLSLNQARDIYIVLNNFYDKISLVSWLSLMDGWQECTEDDGTVNHPVLGGDYNPLQTAKNLEKLIEALYLFSRYNYVEDLFKIPTAYLFNYSVALQELKDDGLEQFNPLYWLTRIFNGHSSKYYVESLQHLFERNNKADQAKMLSNEDVFDVGHELKKIIEVAWLMVQCRQIPAEWLKLNSDDELSDEQIQDLIETEIVCTSREKIGAAVETLESILKVDWKVNGFKSCIDDLVEKSVCGKNSFIHAVTSPKSEIELLIESCYLIYLDLRKKRRFGSYQGYTTL